MTINPYWKQSCSRRWERQSAELNMCGQPGLSATVELAPEPVASLPGFKGNWVYTCWPRESCGAWIGPFDSADLARTACEAHFASDHREAFWPD
jgi:hypothetical protein